MHPTMKRALATLLFALAAAVPAVALADVTVALTAHRVIQKGGREVFEPGDQAFPGQVLEYRAVYRNAGDAAVKQIAATLPIPGGMELLSPGISPRGAHGSLDGRAFAALPLKRKVRLENGREATVEIPVSEVRFLRWTIPTLAANAERSVSARVRVAPIPVASHVRR